MTDELAQSLEDFVLVSDGSQSGRPRSPVSSPANRSVNGETPSYQGNISHPHPQAPLFPTYGQHPPAHHGPPLHGPPHVSPLHGGPPPRGPPHGPPHPHCDHEDHPPFFHRGHHSWHHRKHGEAVQYSNPSTAYVTNSSAPWSNVTLFLHKAISGAHPKAAIMATDSRDVDLLLFATYPGNGAKATPNSTEFPGTPFLQYSYVPPDRRNVGEDNRGSLKVSGITWGKFDYEYNNEPFTLYTAQWSEGVSSTKLQFLVHEPKKASETAESSKDLIKDLMLRASYWEQELRNEVWVFDRGFWQKDAALWGGMQKANWDDVILPPDLKNTIREDVGSFFKNKSTYDDVGIAWKRGIIMYGPPGNGKTISLKATMKELYYSYEISPIPTLYVRSLQSWAGEQDALRMIFEKARSVAPCMLVFEDLDSLINPKNRSYFLNQMDGLDDNNGIFVVGTTNHLDELDPGIVARPSRFDRKYEFGLPGTGEGGRPTYVEYWRKKLENRPGIEFPASLVPKIVDMTDGFSFAYMKEAFVSALLLIAAGHGDEMDREGLFERVILQQLQNLRRQLGNE